MKELNDVTALIGEMVEWRVRWDAATEEERVALRDEWTRLVGEADQLDTRLRELEGE